MPKKRPKKQSDQELADRLVGKFREADQHHPAGPWLAQEIALLMRRARADGKAKERRLQLKRQLARMR